MAEYSLEFIDEARDDFRKLDRSVALRIKRKLEWLAQNIEDVEPNWLRGDLAGMAKIREGDYRIIYQPIGTRRVILIHFIGHRSEAYKRS